MTPAGPDKQPDGTARPAEQSVLKPKKRGFRSRIAAFFARGPRATAVPPRPGGARRIAMGVIALIMGVAGLTARLGLANGAYLAWPTWVGAGLFVVSAFALYYLSMTLERKLWALFIAAITGLLAVQVTPTAAISAVGQAMGLEIDAAVALGQSGNAAWVLGGAAVLVLLAIIVLRRA